ncbi:hypothetical protein [Mucilaginibacter sp.]|uniref:hypothetical protein n=1 Tax=Mucilaginibacter sp. TaxID=1882438 RepID=UPI002606126C|nr:hypothetical protein [Mucilaginibacter sp.]MDB4919819.1 hypothetical protein [Mucilaginibacter sp.]
MAKEYPFKEKIEQKSKELGRTRVWLCAEIGKSESWYFQMESILELQFKVVMQISKALEFDFIVDYYKFLERNALPVSNSVNDPHVPYPNKENSMKVQITISGTDKSFSKGFGKIIETLRSEGNKNGFEIL